MRRRALAAGAALLFAVTAAGIRDRVRAAEGAAPPPAESPWSDLGIARLEAAQIVPEHRLLGRVLDPLPFVDSVLAVTAARRAQGFAQLDARRVEALHARDRNASGRELEAARLAALRATLELQGASARAASVWGRAFSRPDLEALAEQLASGTAAVARLDLPAGASAPPALARIAISAGADEEPTADGELLAPAPTTDPLIQGQGYLVLLAENPPPIGSSLVASLPDGEAILGFYVPRSAIVWQDGRAAVFVKIGEDQFEKRVVSRLGPLRDGWLVAGELQAGEALVVRGAQQLLSRELLASAPGP